MKKVLSCVLGTALLAMLLTGCGKDSETNYSNQNVTGQVTAVDGSSVTLLLGEMSENQKSEAPTVQQNSDGTAPSGASSGDAPSGDAPSGDVPSGDVPSGDVPSGGAPSGDAPSGGAPSGDVPSGDVPSGDVPSGGRAMSSFTAGEDSVTITITDSTVITVAGMGESTDGTIDDIKVGSILEVSFGSNNTVTSITVRNNMDGGDMGGKGGQDNAANGGVSNT